MVTDACPPFLDTGEHLEENSIMLTAPLHENLTNELL